MKLKFNFCLKSAKDYYKILELQNTASKEEIKKKYYELAKKYHPDINKNNQDKFKEISEAYNVLSNQQQRQRFDKQQETIYRKVHQGQKVNFNKKTNSKFYNQSNPFGNNSENHNQFQQSFYKSQDEFFQELNKEEPQQDIRVWKFVAYPLIAAIFYYVLVEIPLGMGKSNQYRYEIDQKTGQAFQVRK